MHGGIWKICCQAVILVEVVHQDFDDLEKYHPYKHRYGMKETVTSIQYITNLCLFQMHRKGKANENFTTTRRLRLSREDPSLYHLHNVGQMRLSSE